MTTPASVAVTAGSGTKIATFEITEGGETREIQRIVLCDALGNEIGSILSSNASSTAPTPVIMSVPYQAVAVSQTSKVLGATGAIGDTLSGVIIQPTGTTVGAVTVYDGTTAVYTYPGGTVGADLRPIIVGMGMTCLGAGWHVTTPANATVLALGKFT